MSKIKLLFIPYTMTNGGGAEKVLALLVNNLDSEKYDIRVQEVHQYFNEISLAPHVKFEKPFINNKKVFLSKVSHRVTLFLLAHFPIVLKKIYKLDCDVVIPFNYQLPSFMLPAFKQEKKIAWFHGDIYDLNETGKEVQKKKQRTVWSDTDAIVTISNKSLHSLEVLFPEFMNKAYIVHNGIDIADVQRLAKEKCEFDFDDLPVLICAGRLDKNKNFSLAIRAISELHKRGIKCRLLILGQGELESELKNLAEFLKISDFVHFCGYKNNPYPYIAASRIFCLTSYSEGFPTVAIETMSLGIPFVTTPVSGASEELSDNEKCGLVSNWNAEEYADKLQKLLTDSELYEQMSKNCLEHVKDYSVEQYVSAFEKVLSYLGVGK